MCGMDVGRLSRDERREENKEMKSGFRYRRTPAETFSRVHSESSPPPTANPNEVLAP